MKPLTKQKALVLKPSPSHQICASVRTSAFSLLCKLMMSINTMRPPLQRQQRHVVQACQPGCSSHFQIRSNRL